MAGLFAKFFGRTVSEGAAFAAGLATGPVLAPVVEEVRQQTWEQFPVRAVEPGDAAEVVAEDVEARDWGAGEAAKHGLDGQRFDALVGAILNAPGIGQLFELWRRDLIDDAMFTHGLRKARLEPRWDQPLAGLKQRLLSLESLANARQQQFIDAGRQYEESALQGLDRERADLLFDLAGLPPGVESMQAAVNRGLADRATFDQAIAEGHTKTKYTDLLFALRQPVLTASTYATLHLKGHITADQMNIGGALTGYTPAQMQLLYLSMGRPAAPGQLFTAAARGIDGPAGRPMDQAQFQTAIAQSDIRPEYGPMLWALRYTYPPLFQISRLVQAKAITPADAIDWATKDRYAPEVIDALRTYWQGGGTQTGDTHVAKAQTQLWTALHKSYVADETDDALAGETLAAIGVPDADHQPILALWQRERGLVRRTLSAAQIKKAVRENLMSVDEGQQRLVAMGYSLADATTYLTE